MQTNSDNDFVFFFLVIIEKCGKRSILLKVKYKSVEFRTDKIVLQDILADLKKMLKSFVIRLLCLLLFSLKSPRRMEGFMGWQKSFFLSTVFVLFFGLMLSGCGKKTVTPEAAGGDSGAMGAAEPLETKVVAGDNIMEGRTSGPMLPVYFDFDSSTIRADQVERIEGNADFLKKNPAITIRIEGNCDPRGTKEYNLALGERRAQSAKKYLVNLGVDADRLNTISWGEEKLLLYGHDEISWAQNRRDDFVIVK